VLYQFPTIVIDAAYSIRHNLWATRRLLDYARSLRPGQLGLSVQGTAGSINYCLAHIVGADQRYLIGLGAKIETKFEEALDSDLSDVIRVHGANERTWEPLLAAPPDFDRWRDRPDRHDRLRLVMLPAQAIHHGTDHRTQVGTILLHHGLDLPRLDVWTYAAEIGDFERHS
jgi:uncharacterized damage-inducible protein DinB